MNSSFLEKLNNKLNMNELVSKPIIENDVAWQQHGTPDVVIDMMLNQYYVNNEFKNNERILILFNVEIIKQIYFKYKDELIFGNLYFVADSKEKFEIIQKLYPNVHLVLCDEHNIEKLMEKIGEFNVKKFDIVFSNPPYNRNLDLKILEKLFNISRNIVFVHPVGFLIDKKFMTSLYNRIRNTNYLKSVSLFWGNALFNIGLFVPACITIWDTQKNDDECIVNDKAFGNGIYKCKINEISFHGSKLNKVNELRDCLNEIIKINGSLYDHKVKNDYSDLTDFSVKIAILRGHPSDNNKLFNDDFFTLMCKNNDDNFIDSTFRYKDGYAHTYWNIWAFNNKSEQLNFINYCNSKIVRFIMTFVKVGQNLATGEMRFIPWLDFTQEWNDAKLCKEFKISDELWNYINNFIPDYYDDYKSGF